MDTIGDPNRSRFYPCTSKDGMELEHMNVRTDSSSVLTIRQPLDGGIVCRTVYLSARQRRDLATRLLAGLPSTIDEGPPWRDAE